MSLDGGGIRGAFVAAFLADIEERLNCRIADYFDLIAGTSTGGIIAAGLAAGVPAQKIEEMYRGQGPFIFGARTSDTLTPWEWCFSWFLSEKWLKPNGLIYDHLKQSKYTSAELHRSLTDVFGDRTLEDSTTRLVIPSVDLNRGQTVVFKTPHLPGMVVDRHYKFVDVLLATAAAPSYFPHATIRPGSAFVDGGLWANNPTMVAFAETMKIRESANREDHDLPIELENIHLLSIGTGKAAAFHKPRVTGEGLYWWGPRLLNLSALTQSQGINFQAQYILGERAYRVDFDIPDPSWTLDNLENLNPMLDIGRRQFPTHMNNLSEAFFNSKAVHSYHPFPDANPAGEPQLPS